METNTNKLSFMFQCTNNSDRYVLVGNCREFISEHGTLEEAQKAANKIDVEKSRWFAIFILSPGETGTYKSSRTIPDEPEAIDPNANAWDILMGDIEK